MIRSGSRAAWVSEGDFRVRNIRRAVTAFFGQLLLGLINGSFYALLSIGLAVIFGLLNIINFAHGAQYTAGAFLAWMLLNYVGVNYWAALVLVPLIMAVFAVVTERLLISRTYRMDHLYGLLLTFGIALLIEGGLRQAYGVSGLPYTIPKALSGGVNLGFMFLPWYRGWAAGVAGAVPAGLGADGKDPHRRHVARGHRESGGGAPVRHQRAFAHHADLCVAWRWPRWPA